MAQDDGAAAAPGTGAKAAAQWMFEQVTERRELWQSDAAEYIKRNFDDGLTYLNDSGNLAIGRPVLAAFRALGADSIVWENGAKCWRRRNQYAPPGKRQAG